MLSYGTVSVLIVMSGLASVKALISASNAAFSVSPDQLTNVSVAGPPPLLPLVALLARGRVSPAHPLRLRPRPDWPRPAVDLVASVP